MLARSFATVRTVVDSPGSARHLITEYGPAIAYTEIVGEVRVGDRILLNRTANVLGLGTGGVDFVMAVINNVADTETVTEGHIIKLRYSPSQLSVFTLEENPELAPIWEKSLDGFPVVVCQLHSQIAHIAAAVKSLGMSPVYVMTDTASLACSFSFLVEKLQVNDLITASITAGQAFGGDYESVTIHSALLAAKYHLSADVAIVCQGPGNVGTGTKYGFSGIDQAGILDIVSALGGRPIAAVRASSADPRSRHQGVSHHSTTALRLVRSSCTIPVPAGMIDTDFDTRHTVVRVKNFQEAFDLLDRLGIRVTSMGRDFKADRLFFECAAAAGIYAASLGKMPG